MIATTGSIKLDKIKTLVMPTVIHWRGLNYLAIRGLEDEGGDQKGKILFLAMEKNWSIRTQEKWSAEKTSGRPCLVGHENDLHCFFWALDEVSKEGFIADKVMAPTGLDEPPKIKKIGGEKQPLNPGRQPAGVCVAPHNDGIIVVMNTIAGPGNPKEIDFYLCAWNDLYSHKNAVRQSIYAPPEYKDATFHRTEAVCVIVPPSHSKSKNPELHLVWGTSYYFHTTHENGVLFGECNVLKAGKTRILDTENITWTKCAQKNPYPGQITLHFMHLGIEGRVHALACIKKGFDGETKDIQLWMREEPGKWTNQGNPIKDIEPRDVYLAGSMADVADEREILTTPSLANAELEDKSLPVKRTFFYLKPKIQDEFFYVQADFGTLRRRGLEKIPAEKRVLLGIIEGPPPIPTENINIPDALDPYTARGAGTTAFAQTKDASEGFKVEQSASVLVEAGGQVGFLAGMAVEAAFSAGYKFLYDSKCGTTRTKQYEVNIKLEKPRGEEYAVQAIGHAILLDSQWQGYAYEYMAVDGKVPPSVSLFYQVWRTGMEIIATPYYLNPNIGPTPGNLQTYIRKTEQLKVFEEKAFPLMGQKKRLATSWSNGGKVIESVEAYAQTKFSHSAVFDVKIMGGAKWEEKWLGTTKGKFMVGVKIGNEEAWSSEAKDKLSLSTKVETRGHGDAKGAYKNYTYYTYQLNPDTQWGKEFLDNLVTPTWPVKNGKEYRTNEPLKMQIIEGGKPWKIVYALGPHEKNP